MNHLPDNILKKTNEAAIYNLYLYLAHITAPAENAALQSIITDLEINLKSGATHTWNSRDIYRLSILINAVKHCPFLAKSKISNLTTSKSGLTACSFTNQHGETFVAFRGTGKGEWIDNGEGLSGVPEENTYKTYEKSGIVLSRKTLKHDYATDQQVEALNWFYSIAAKNGWTKDNKITLSGHSKGGNKAQFVAIHSDLVDSCYSFDGQGFSTEALESFKTQYGEKFEVRTQNIYSFSTDNDYVNVLGARLMPQNNIYYFESHMGFHYLEDMLNVNGRFNLQSEQGELSLYVETISKKLMGMPPHIRKYATLGVMNIFQRFLGEGAALNGDMVSFEQTIIGMGIAVDLLLSEFY
ncbi:MAG: DUF2974 domain-containing protein [Clostridia bacterium]|nr:DUF2974 domain-containing protein [Clostridia bacterium]